MRFPFFMFALVSSFLPKGLAECNGKYERKFGKVVYTVVDKMPSAGIDVPTFLTRHLKCPNCRDDEYQSRYIVGFVVSEDGKVLDLKINNRSREKMTSWEIAVYDAFLRLNCAWFPGACEGRKVSVRMRIPLTICLE